MIEFVEQFRHYLYGQHFVIRTDHASLRWLRNFKKAEGMLARWLSALEAFDFEIVYRKGRLHANADSLSRKPTRKCHRPDCMDCANRLECVEPAVCLLSHDDGQSNGHPGSADDHVESSGANKVPDEWLEPWTEEELKKWQSDDPILTHVIKWLKSSSDRPMWETISVKSRELKHYWAIWDT